MSNNHSKQITYIPLHQIETHADNPNVHQEEAIQTLALNIREFGLLHPIGVVSKALDTEGYSIVYGAGRFKAFQFLNEQWPGEGWDSIPAIVLEESDDYSVWGRRLSENKLRSFNWVGECIELANMKADGKSRTDYPDWISRCVAELRAHDDLPYFQWDLQHRRIVEITPVAEVVAEPEIVKIKTLITPQECYSNATMAGIVLAADYCEGWVLTDVGLIRHAWNILDDKYFDVTWELSGQRLGHQHSIYILCFRVSPKTAISLWRNPQSVIWQSLAMTYYWTEVKEKTNGN